MNISVKNIALIRKADVELKGITVVAGWNQTGKTTIGKALYAIIQSYTNLPERILASRRTGILKCFDFAWRRSKNLTPDMHPLRIMRDFEASVSNEELLEWLSDKDHARFRVFLDHWIHSNKKYSAFFSLEEFEFLFHEICVILDRPDAEYRKYLIESCMTRVFKGQINCFYNQRKGKIEFSFPEDVVKAEFDREELIDFTENEIRNVNAVYIESFNVLDLYHVVTGTGGHSRYSRFLSSSSTACINLLQKSAEDEEESYEGYAEAKKIKGIIQYIIDKVTHGMIKSDASGICFVDQRSSQPIELSGLSAGLKIFVVIQTLLENGSLKEGDVLLIDEPEVNLHPEWQIILAEVLVLLHKELGLFLYINSHSPYFIRAIEVKMAHNKLTREGKYYLTVKDGDGLYNVEDVSDHTERIYELLYKPLEEL